jgi:hypothetical protein
MLDRYDPDQTPDAEAWLDLDEQERIQLVEDFHARSRVELPNAKLHAVIHVVVENQIATGLESVLRAIPRLMAQGLSRHDAVHAVGSIVAGQIFALSRDRGLAAEAVHARYDAEIDRLSAKRWHRRVGRR